MKVRWTYFSQVLVFLMIFSLHLNGQDIGVIPCDLKSHHFSKIIPVNDTSLLLFATRSNEYYTNYVYSLNSIGEVVRNATAFDCFSRSDGNYFMPLNNQVYVCDYDDSQGGSYSRFYTDHRIDAAGKVKDTIDY